MADKTLKVRLEATDNISGPLKKVSGVATEVGRAIETAGQKGDQGFDKVERSAREAEQAVDRTADSAKRAAVGFSELDFALTAVGAGLTYAGNAAMEQEQVIIGLRQAYGDAADEMLRYAEQMSETTIFNDDDIMRGERYFATLRNNYDLSIEQIQELMAVTADLASAYGTSFEDASSRITAAIRGEGEAAEYLGLTMNQQAIDRDNLTLKMSNQEAAQFRLNALYQQTGVYVGTAEKVLNSEVGTRAKLSNAIQDNAQALASFIGPLGTSVAGMALASTGLANMLGVLNKMSPALRTITPALAAVAKNPLFIGAAALTGGLVIWDKISETMNRSEREQQALAESSANLTQTLSDMQVVMGEFEAAKRFELAITSGEQALERYRASYQEWIDLLYNPQTQGESPIWQMAQAKAAEEGIFNVVAVAQQLEEQLALTDNEATQVNNALSALGPLFTNTAIDQARLSAEIDRLFQQFAETGDADALVAGLGNLNTNSQDLLLSTNALATSLAELNQEIDHLKFTGQMDLARDVEQLGNLQAATEGVLGILSSGEAQAYNEAWETIWEAIRGGEVDADAVIRQLAVLDEQLASGQITQRQYAAAVVDLGLNLDEYSVSAEEATVHTRSLAEGMAILQERADAARVMIEGAGAAAGQFALDAQAAEDAARGWITTIGEGAGAFATEELEAYNEMVQEFIAGSLELARQGDFLSQWNLTAQASQASILAEHIRDVGDELDSTFRVIVGNTNAIGNQMQGIADWSTDLIGDPGYWAEIDDLLNEGRISLEKYNEAQRAQMTITQANATVQRDLLAIQAAQAPLIADSADNMADYIQRARMMNDGINDAVDGQERQLAMLGMLDDAMLGQVQQFTEMAGIYQNLGPDGAASMQMLIDSITASDPVLTAMLVQMGLIKEVAEGEYVFNLDASGAISDLDQLGIRIGHLIDALQGNELGTYEAEFGVTVTGVEDVEAAEQSIYDVIAAANQQAIVSIATRLQPPEPRDWVKDGYTGGWTPDPLPIPSVIEPPAQPPAEWFDLPPIKQPVELDFSGIGSIAGGAAGDALAAAQNAVSITVTQTGAEETTAALQTVTDTAATIPEAEIINVIVMGAGEAVTGLDAVTTAAAGIPEAELISVLVMGAGEAVASLNAVASAAAGIPESVSTTITTNLVTNRVTNYSTNGYQSPYADGNLPPGGRGGGIVGNLSAFAGGGLVPFVGGEAGPELAYFAGGGMASLPVHGIYSAPAGTYISPAHTTGSSAAGAGDVTIQVTVQGDVYGIQDLTERVTRELAPALASAIRQRQRSLGGF